MIELLHNRLGGCVAGFLFALFFLGCVDTSTSVSTPHQTESTAPPSSSFVDNQKIWITIKDDVSEKAIRSFVEYLGCSIEDNVPKGSPNYVIAPPRGVKAEKMLPKFQSHPWIERASLK